MQVIAVYLQNGYTKQSIVGQIRENHPVETTAKFQIFLA